jgi:hypothetical protein
MNERQPAHRTTGADRDRFPKFGARADKSETAPH